MTSGGQMINLNNTNIHIINDIQILNKVSSISNINHILNGKFYSDILI
jgi:hypothetical protein